MAKGFAYALIAIGLALLGPVGCAPVAAPARDAAGVRGYPLAVVAAECPLRVPDELAEGESIVCGRLRVPQDRTRPDGLQVEIPFAQVHAESAHPRPDPLVYVVGGPGGSALTEFDTVYGWFRPLRRDRDLVIYDQRGTLLAQPALDCSAVTGGAAVDGTVAAGDMPPTYGPLDADDVALLRCADRLQAQGVDWAHYDTPTHAQDLIDLVAALGYRSYTVYATSYGTRIALEAMRQGAPGLRAAVLDSVFPPSVNAYEERAGPAQAEIVAHAIDQCAADPDCARTYPDLPARLARVVERLNAQPLKLALDWQPSFDGADLLAYLYRRLDPGSLPYLPRLIDELDRGESNTLMGLLAGALPPPAPRPAGQATAAPGDDAAVQAFVLALNSAYYLHQEQLSAQARAEWQRLAARNPDRSRLRRFIEVYLPAAAVGGLLAQLDNLAEADLAAVFAELAGVPRHPLVEGANLAVECRDELPFNRYATAAENTRKLGLPPDQTEAQLAQLRRLWDQCALLPIGTVALTQTLPVAGDLPVLIFQAGLDSVTPPSWSAQAAAYLPHATVYKFPGLAHVVIRQPLSQASGCPVRLARAFLDDPQQPPDPACIAASYRIDWVLPGE